MDDYISRRTALDAIQREREFLLSLGMDGAEHILTHYGYNVIAEDVLPADVRPVRWIPVTERLPENVRDVQITVFWHDAWRTMLGYYDGSFWHLYAPMHSDIADVEVIGWMEKPAPMPTPPKEETDNG